MLFNQVGSGHIHWDARGEDGATPVVLINSLGTDWRSWQQVARKLGGLRTIAYDKRGHGLSSPAGDDCSISTHAADLRELLAQLDVERPIVCGVSIGALIAIQLAGLMPVRALMLCCSGIALRDRAFWDDRIASVRAGGLAAIADGVIPRWLSADFRRANPEIAAVMQQMLLATPPEGYIASCRAIRDADIAEAAHAVGVPALCIAGEADSVAPPAGMRELADAIRGSRYVELEGCAHLPHIEQHGEIVRMLECLARESQ